MSDTVYKFGNVRAVCLTNIGYCAGYLSMEAINKVNALTGATHIAFGGGVRKCD
jgi:hypothetical protein